jgi:membrane-bound lytic murein transglycosylase D
MMKILTALFFATVSQVAAQTPEVPHKMDFAGISLTIRDDARREIQKDVDALTQSLRHYNIKAERAKTYFPIIEKIFREEQVPDDFKYLALQESALIADAVSTSNAVGFWQFKDFTAVEMGLRVDKEVDERLNIVSSSRAAARYIKKNNTFFDNWIYALQAYQMGAGGVMKTVKDTQEGARQMEINSRTYWYVKKYLAHKIAFEKGVTGKAQTEVITFANNKGKSLAELAAEVSVDETALKDFNKWTKSGKIPSDRTYVVIVPLSGEKVTETLAAVPTKSTQAEARVSPEYAGKALPVRRKINGIAAIQAISGETPSMLAARAGVEVSRFVQWNELSSSSASLMPGTFYFLAKKASRAKENFHKLIPGETLWMISQRYGVQEKKLRKYNRLGADENPPSGTMLWLASKRPKSNAVGEPVENPVVVDNEDTFNWSATSGEKVVPVEIKETLPAETIVVPDKVPVEKNKASDSLQILQESAITLDAPDTLDAPRPNVDLVPKTEHLVQVGETLYGIAKANNVGVMDLVKWNNLDLQQGIKPGQLLKLSDSQPIKEKESITEARSDVNAKTLHEVRASDTLYSIARQYGVTIKELMDWNGKKDFSLSVGEKLKIRQAQ